MTETDMRRRRSLRRPPKVEEDAPVAVADRKRLPGTLSLDSFWAAVDAAAERRGD